MSGQFGTGVVSVVATGMAAIVTGCHNQAAASCLRAAAARHLVIEWALGVLVLPRPHPFHLAQMKCLEGTMCALKAQCVTGTLNALGYPQH